MNMLELVDFEFVLIWFGIAIMGILAGLGAVIFGVIGIFSGNPAYWATFMLDCAEIVIPLFMSALVLGVLNRSSLKKQKCIRLFIKAMDKWLITKLKRKRE